MYRGRRRWGGEKDEEWGGKHTEAAPWGDPWAMVGPKTRGGSPAVRRRGPQSVVFGGNESRSAHKGGGGGMCAVASIRCGASERGVDVFLCLQKARGSRAVGRWEQSRASVPWMLNVMKSTTKRKSQRSDQSPVREGRISHRGRQHGTRRARGTNKFGGGDSAARGRPWAWSLSVRWGVVTSCCRQRPGRPSASAPASAPIVEDEDF